jgi:large subunit ribosomal protein L9
MKVILLQDIYKQGVAGEVVEVADGYARNFLLPRSMALRATKSAVKTHQHLSAQVAVRRAAYDQKLNEVARLIHDTELFFERRAATNGKLFGSVTNQEIIEELDKVKGIDLNRRRLATQNIRELGRHNVAVRLGSEMTPILHVTIVKEGELAEFLAERERQKQAAEQATAGGTVPAAEETASVTEAQE